MGTTIYEFGVFALDTSKRLVTRNGEVISLAPKTFDLLLLLVESDGRALSKSELMHALWPNTFVEETNLSFQISTLRKALGEDAAKWIETLPKHGYRFTAHVQRLDKPAESGPDSKFARMRLNRSAGAQWLPVIGAAVLIVAVISVWGVWQVSRGANDSTTASPATPLTASLGYQQNPTLSPEGNQVAFSWDGAASENYDIYVKLVGPGEPVRLTTDPAVDDQPVWSPDGRSIAFFRFRSDSEADIFVIPALGGAEQKVATARMLKRGRKFLGTRNLAWTPDGKWLAFGGAVPDHEALGIWLVATATGEQRRLTTVSPPDLCDWAPAFTVDGRYLAFIRERTLGTALVYVIPLSQFAPGGPPQQVSPQPANILGLAWKPDGSALLVSWAGFFGLSRAYSLPFRPGRALDARDVKLLPFGERARGISIAANGRIVYAAQFTDSNLWRIGLGSQHQPPQGPIAASTLHEQTPDYSPDGNRLAFASTRSGVEEIWLANADGSKPKQITFTGGPQCSNPRWSRDGRLILFNSRREGSADLYLLDTGTSEVRRITNHPNDEVEPNWSRDGRTIYFGSNRTGRDEIWRMPAVGGEPVQVTRQGGETAIESPDGRYLYYAKSEPSRSAIWRVPVSGGEEHPLFDGLSSPLNFVVAARGIYFLAAGERQNQTSLDLYEYASGKRSTLVSIGKRFWWGMALAPDEKSLLYSVIDSSGSNLMVVDKFR